MWILSKQGELVNMHYMRNIGLNTQVVPGEFAVVALYAKNAMKEGEQDGVVLETFRLKEMADGYLEKIHKELNWGMELTGPSMIQ